MLLVGLDDRERSAEMTADLFSFAAGYLPEYEHLYIKFFATFLARLRHNLREGFALANY